MNWVYTRNWGAYDSPVPDLTLTDDELRDSAMALRAAAHQAMQDAQAMAQSSKDHGFADAARRYAALAARFEQAKVNAR
jgi:hypothetical protein